EPRLRLLALHGRSRERLVAREVPGAPAHPQVAAAPPAGERREVVGAQAREGLARSGARRDELAPRAALAVQHHRAQHPTRRGPPTRLRSAPAPPPRSSPTPSAPARRLSSARTPTSSAKGCRR